jgi:ABC-type cobalamin/Fe3+-siderophores transport system ATPase subunit
LSKPTTLKLPLSGATLSSTDVTEINTSGSIVIIGANGSGKTRLGAWLEFDGPQKEIVHRVSAQKSLDFPDSVSPIPMHDAEIGLYYGVSRGSEASFKKYNDRDINTRLAYRRDNKWNNKPAVGMVSDFEHLLTYLFSEEHKVSSKFRKEAFNSTIYIQPPSSLLDQAQKIWENVISHRELIIEEGTVKAKARHQSGSAYNASEMSDGERVAFYLIGQCITRPQGSIVIVDEPEIHLHRGVQTALWNAIEIARPDCLFVYITHDLDFAATRATAQKLWIKDYNGTAWDWRSVPETEDLPEEALLTVLGSRKPVLFTEGSKGGFEQIIFSLIYPEWTILPRGNCDQVIASTDAFNGLKHLHGLECHGIIDLDFRTEHEVQRLLNRNIHVLGIQEIENLFLVENVLTAIVQHASNSGLLAKSASETVEDIKNFTFELLRNDQQLLVSRKTGWEIEKTLRRFDAQARGVEDLSQALNQTAAMNVQAVYEGIDNEVTRTIAERDYAALHRLYNNKGLTKQIGRFFRIQDKYTDYVKRVLGSVNRGPIVTALASAAPELPLIPALAP